MYQHRQVQMLTIVGGITEKKIFVKSDLPIIV